MTLIRAGYTFSEAQQYIGNVSRSTMYRLMKEGLPSYSATCSMLETLKT